MKNLFDACCNGKKRSHKGKMKYCNHPLCKHCGYILQEAYGLKAIEKFHKVPLDLLNQITINLKKLPIDISKEQLKEEVDRAKRKLINALRKYKIITMLGGIEIAPISDDRWWNLHLHAILFCGIEEETFREILNRAFPEPRSVVIKPLATEKYNHFSKNEQIRAVSGYSVKFKNKKIPNALLAKYLTLMDSLLHGRNYGITFEHGRDNPYLKMEYV
jgi:hypothetical protein